MAGDVTDTIAIRWNSLSAKAWDKALARLDFVPVQQSYAFGEMTAGHGGDVLRAEMLADGALVGLCQFVIRKFPGFRLVTAIMGPVWLEEGMPSALKARLLDQLGRTAPLKGLHVMLVMPPGAADEAPRSLKLRQVVSPYHTALIDLSQDEDTLLANADGKWRNRLKAAEKAGLTISPLGRRPEQYLWLLEAERRQRKRVGYQALSPLMVPAFQDAAGKDGVLGLEAKLGVERVAGMLFFRAGGSATYHIGWSSPSGREANAMNLLLWHSIRQLKKKGDRTLDLGGVDTDHAAGIARFKLGAGGDVRSQSGTWLLRPRLR